MKGAIELMQQGEKAMNAKEFAKAQTLLADALKQAPEDYAGLLLMAKCLVLQNKEKEAEIYIAKAKEVYPQEAQSRHLSGIVNTRNKNFSAAYQDFKEYDQRLPGNPSSHFMMGYCLEGMGKKEQSAQMYYQYLRQVRQGDEAQHAYKSLVNWGYMKGN